MMPRTLGLGVLLVGLLGSDLAAQTPPATAPAAGELVFTAANEPAPFSSIGAWRFRRGADDLACQLWFTSRGDDDVVLRLRRDGETASLLVAAPNTPMLPSGGAIQRLAWSAGDLTASTAAIGIGDGGDLAVAEIKPDGLTSAQAIQLLLQASTLSLGGVEVSMPPVHPMIWLVFSQCMANPGAFPEGSTARWRAAQAR